jgi:hypothetical protein
MWWLTVALKCVASICVVVGVCVAVAYGLLLVLGSLVPPDDR